MYPNAPDRPRILLADDDPSIALLLKATLEFNKLQCHCVDNGVAALEAVRDWMPDLIVLDVNMPGMDGYQVLAELRKEGRRIPVLLLTGNDEKAEIQKGFDLGATDYVVKPFNPMAVAARIRQLVTQEA